MYVLLRCTQVYYVKRLQTPDRYLSIHDRMDNVLKDHGQRAHRQGNLATRISSPGHADPILHHSCPDARSSFPSRRIDLPHWGTLPSPSNSTLNMIVALVHRLTVSLVISREAALRQFVAVAPHRPVLLAAPEAIGFHRSGVGLRARFVFDTEVE
jgi:hypothetical protein